MSDIIAVTQGSPGVLLPSLCPVFLQYCTCDTAFIHSFIHELFKAKLLISVFKESSPVGSRRVIQTLCGRVSGITEIKHRGAADT
jgi:hypothetical protein